jgi:putative peptide zinc metalloprotease protein
MSTLRRSLAALALVPGLALLGAAAPAAAAGDDNTAVAVNTEDGASVFRLAFSVRRVANGVVDQTNSAYALASCTECQTVALAFQVVLANGDVDVAVPENRAVAYNDQCAECVTYASAMQIVLGFDGPVRFTPEGYQRLAVLHQSLRRLEERAAELTLPQLNAEVQAAKAELVAILEQELVEIETGPSNEGDAGTAGATDPVGGSGEVTTTSSTAPGSTTTAPGSVATSTTTAPSPTSSSPNSSTTSTTTSTAGSSTTTTTTVESGSSTTTTTGEP